MKIEIVERGDPSVGIPPNTITIDWPGLENYVDSLQRNGLRRQLREFFEGWCDGPFQVYLEDECEDCGQSTLIRDHCTNPKCISNMPDDLKD